MFAASKQFPTVTFNHDLPEPVHLNEREISTH